MKNFGTSPAAASPLVDDSVESARAAHFGSLVGNSAAMRELFTDLAKIAPAKVPVLIEGETGTGKEQVAQSIHRASARADQSCIVFDCSAVAPTLVESELFGHDKGAFTGAVSSRPGVFELAHRGTLFLDEFGELPRDLQPKLLRLLERGEVRRLGGTRTIHVDVRVIAATNRNLAREIQAGTFRQDLYFRVAAARVRVPALRERLDDIPLLVRHFLSLDGVHRAVDTLPPGTWDLFRSYAWPGNVRELRNIVQLMTIMPDRALQWLRSYGITQTPSEAPSSGPSPLPIAPPRLDAPLPMGPLRCARRAARNAFERAYLCNILTQSNGNITRAADLAQVSRQVMTKLVAKHRSARALVRRVYVPSLDGTVDER